VRAQQVGAMECVTPVPEAGLDLSFGDSGKVTAHHEGAAAIAVQSDGRIVMVGGLTLARYNGDGSPDSSFGSGGTVGVVLGISSYTAAQSLAVQPDGVIVVGGYTTSDTQGTQYEFALARYTAEGKPDLDFGGGGTVTTDFAGGYGKAYSVLIQEDERIVAAGPAAGEGPLPRTGFGVERYTADGVPDESFGSGGKVTTSIEDGAVTAAAAVLQPDGKVVVTGPVFGASGGYEAFYLVRYTIDGAPDPDFGDGGLVRADFGLSLDHYPTALALQGGGEVVVAGWIGNTFAAARFDAAGQPDLGFGSGGLVTTPFDSYDARAQGVAIQPDGKIVVVGYTGEMSNEDFAVARYSNGGELDPEFGSGGKLTIDFFGNSDRAACIAIQADGKILVAGSAWRGSMLGLVRMLA
jgi:uncharacterized delta-60 repeat protein